MDPLRRPVFAFTILVFSLFLTGNLAYAGEKPEIIRLDARYTEKLVKINVHWQSANPVALIHAIVGGETQDMEVDPYDNHRNPDGYSGESVITVKASPTSKTEGIPYIVQIEDDLRQKSEQVTGRVRTAAAQAAGGGAGSGTDSWSASGAWSASGTGSPPTGFPGGGGSQTGGNAWSKAKQGQPGELIDQVLDFTTGGGSGGGGGSSPGTSSPGILKNENFGSGGPPSFLDGLNQGDEVAVYLGDVGRPFTVKKIHFLFGGSTGVGVVTLKVSQGSGNPGNSQVLYSAGFEVEGSDTSFQEVDLAAFGAAVPVQAGGVWVSFLMEHAGLPGIGVDTSANGAPGRNWIRQSGSWSDFQAVGIPGNAIIRVEVQ